MTGGELALAKILIAQLRPGVDYSRPKRAHKQIATMVRHAEARFRKVIAPWSRKLRPLSPAVVERLRAELYAPLGEPAP